MRNSKAQICKGVCVCECVCGWVAVCVQDKKKKLSFTLNFVENGMQSDHLLFFQNLLGFDTGRLISQQAPQY